MRRPNGISRGGLLKKLGGERGGSELPTRGAASTNVNNLFRKRTAAGGTLGKAISPLRESGGGGTDKGGKKGGGKPRD